MKSRKRLFFSHEHKVITGGMLIDKKIGDAYARSLTAGAPRKSDRGARFTFDDRHSADTDDDRQFDAELDAVGL